MGAVTIRLLAELRRLWRALCVAAVVGGLAGAVAIAALTGAARTDTALDDYLDRTAYPDVAMDAFPLDPKLLAQVRQLDEVDALGGVIYTAQQPRGLGLVAGIDVVGVVAMTPETWVSVDRFTNLDGRLPHAVGEVMIQAPFASRFGIGLGDELTVDAMAADQLDAVFSQPGGPDPRGRSHTAIVVGIAHDPLGTDGDNGGFALFLPYAFAGEYSLVPPIEAGGVEGDVLLFRPELRALLAGGSRDRDRFVGDVTEIYDGDVDTTASVSRSHLEDSESPDFAMQATSLRLFAIAAAVVGLVAFGHVVARTQSLSASDDQVLAAVGLRRRHRRAVLVALGGSAALGAGAVAAFVSPLLAPFTTLGRTRGLTTDSGIGVPPGLLLSAVAMLVFAYFLRVALSGARAAGPTHAATTIGIGARQLARLAPTPEALVGSRFATSGGRGSQSVPVLPVLAGASAGLAGVIAALTIGASIDHLLATPALFGNGWDVEVVAQAAGDDPELVDQTGASLANDDRTAAVAVARLRQLDADGIDLGALQIEHLKGHVDFGVLRGRTPEHPDEIAFDREDLDRLDREVGDTVVVTAGDDTTVLTIVGQLAGRNAAVALSGPHLDTDEDADLSFFVTLDGSTDRGSYVEELSDRFPEVTGPDAANEPVERLALIRSFPYLFAAFLALVAVSAVGHGLVVTVRRRRAVLGVLRALGYRQQQVGRVIAWQASTVALIAMLIGLPAGLLAAVGIWGVIAGRVDAIARTAVPVGAVAITLAVVLVVANALAALPARRAARLHPTEVLRSE